MKKILILYTGGTIGMDYTLRGLAPVPGLLKTQIDTLEIVSDVEINLIEYPNLIDSSDIRLSDWQNIISDITKNYLSYDGFIVIHGTDTMAYTASILAFALQGLARPVILTGAQLPLIHRRSDGWNNLIDAIYAASRSDLHEVAIVFNNKLLRGCRTQKISTYRFFGFDSIDNEPLAEFGIKINWFTKRWLNTEPETFSPVIPQPCKILNLSLRPGFTTEFINNSLRKQDMDALILETYGSGNIPFREVDLIDALRDAVKRDIVILNITQVIAGRVSNEYANGSLNELGIISGADMTVEAALAKLTILFSSNLGIASIKDKLSKNLVGEFTLDADN